MPCPRSVPLKLGAAFLKKRPAPLLEIETRLRLAHEPFYVGSSQRVQRGAHQAQDSLCSLNGEGRVLGQLSDQSLRGILYLGIGNQLMNQADAERRRRIDHPT